MFKDLSRVEYNQVFRLVGNFVIGNNGALGGSGTSLIQHYHWQQCDAHLVSSSLCAALKTQHRCGFLSSATYEKNNHRARFILSLA